MGDFKFKNWIKSLQTKSSLALLVTAAVLIELTSAVQYWYAKKGIREQVEQRTHKRLIDIIRPTPKTVEALTNLEIPASVEIEIKR